MKEIDRCQKIRRESLLLAEHYDKRADAISKSGNQSQVNEILKNREEADRLRRKANRITDLRLAKLKNALSAFRTNVLPGMGRDKAVVLESVS